MIVIPFGCSQSLTPKQEVRVYQRTFEEVVDALVILRKADKFDDNEWNKILLLMDEGEILLVRWTDAVIQGEIPTMIDKFRALLNELIEYQKKGGS
jgi:hypothetical protein